MTLLHSPWSFTQSTEQNRLCGEIRDSRGHLVFYRAVTSEEDKAAMQCAAASPDMLAALRKAIGDWPTWDDPDEAVNGGDLVEWFDSWRRSALTAIAKAEGRANG
jgi:hypothetical protein